VASIRFEYKWDDPTRRDVIRLTALDGWSWKDYHVVARVVSLNVSAQPPQSVDVLIDFSKATGAFPAGISAHARTFGKRLTPALSGVAFVIGVPEHELAKLGVEPGKPLTTAEGQVHFIAEWRMMGLIRAMRKF
jgi:hypothetical protein